MKSSKKEMKKRLLALLLCITMVMNGGISTFAEGSEQSGHTHTEACYTNVETKELVCKVPEEEAHMHGPSCYTENKQLTCAIEASEGHVHTEECVGVITEAVTGNVCQPEEGAEHTHTEECVGVISEEVTGNVCGLEESEGHTHGDECYTVSSELTCTVPETEGHKHVDECYHVIPAGTLVCTLAETADETQKGAPSDICKCGNPECTCETCEEGCTCETAEKDEKAEETENKEETKQPEKTEYSVEGGETTPKVSITLADAAHIPDEAVLEVDSVTLTDEEAAAIEGAAKAEGIYSENVTALDICFELEVVDEETGETTLENPQPLDGNEVNVAVALPGIEADDEVSVYHLGYETVTDENGEEAKEIKIENMDGSVNAETGAVEFATSHFSYYIFVEEGVDPATVDVETAEIWEATLPELTGVYGDDVAAIANSQLGYKHSEVNVITDEEGNVTGHYSRYGAWNNTPYAEWATLFAKFCVSYAKVPADRFPIADTAADWMNLLNSEDYGMFVPATISPDEYTACVGDLLFLDINADGTADRVAVIVEVAEDGTIKTVEELDGVVANASYAAGDTRLLGYGMMPFNMEGIEADTLEGSTGHTPQTGIAWPNNLYNKDEVDPPTDSDVLELNKTINKNADENLNTFELNLEAYATGETATVTTVSPMDITLVLDRSGSMVQARQFLTVDPKEGLETGCTYYDYYGSNSSTRENGINIPTFSDDTKKYGGKISYYWGQNVRKPNPITYCRCESCLNPETNEGKWVKELSTYKDTTTGEQLYEVLGTTAEVEAKLLNGKLTLYETNMQATERALKAYLSMLKAQSEAYGVEHRVAIVSYEAGNYKTYANNGEFSGNYPTTAYMKVSSEWEEIQDAISKYTNLSQSGNNTPTHKGMEAAKKIHDDVWSKDTNHGKPMIVVFADGAPGSGTNYYEEWGNLAIKHAEELKDPDNYPKREVPIYVVGLYDYAGNYEVDGYEGLRTDYYEQSDRFFEYLSSNFNLDIETRDSYYDGSDGGNDAVKGATKNPNANYFYPTGDPQALAQAFAEIAVSTDTQVSTSVTLDGTTVLRDQISTYFEHECTCGATEATAHTCIEVYTQNWNGSGWESARKVYPGKSQDEDIVTGTIGVNVNGKQIDVTGFSYKDYPVVQNETGGKKIVVKVDVETEEGFWGGNNVPTNEAPTNTDDATGSAIYFNSKVIEAFPQPEANVPLSLNIVAQDKTIYYGGAITPSNLLTGITAGYKTVGTADVKGVVTVNPNGTLTPAEAWMDDYATITWDIYADVEWTDEMTTLPANAVSNKAYGDYVYKITSTPRAEATDNTKGHPGINAEGGAIAGTAVVTTGLSDTDTGYAYILVPEVVFQDSVINFGFKPDNPTYYTTTNKVTSDGQENWFEMTGSFTAEPAEGDDKPDTYPAVSSDKPELTYTYVPRSESFVADTPVNVTVTSSILDGASGDITDVTTFKWVTCTAKEYHDSPKEDICPAVADGKHLGSEDSFEFWIHVDEPYELPSTGGMGTYWYTIGGAVLMMGTSLMIYKKKREEVLGSR